MHDGRSQRQLRRSGADDHVEWALRELEQVLAERAEDPRARDALDALRRAFRTARAGARTDPLTQLPNRAAFYEALEDTLERRKHHPPAPLALLFLDLDGFKAVNDRCGHAAGDALLAMVARRILSSVREHDLVARHGGDEFVVLLESVESRALACSIASRIVEAVSAPYTLDHETFEMSCSIGLALCPEHGDTGAELLRHADKAMYLAKERGGHGYAVFDPQRPHGSERIHTGAFPTPAFDLSAAPLALPRKARD